jgi:hypothetical protein
MKVGTVGESVAIPLDDVYARFPQKLHMFVSNKWDMGFDYHSIFPLVYTSFRSTALSDERHWRCISHLNDNNIGFPKFGDAEPIGYILMPLVNDYSSTSSNDDDDDVIDVLDNTVDQVANDVDTTDDTQCPDNNTWW